MVPRQCAAHRSQPQLLTGRIADLSSRLRLTKGIANRQAPRGPYSFNDLGIERLTGTGELAQNDRPAAQVLLDHHAPHSWRRAERRHTAFYNLVQQRLSAK